MIVGLFLPCTGPLCLGKLVPITHFHKHSETLTRLEPYCKSCKNHKRDEQKKSCEFAGCTIRVHRLSEFCKSHSNSVRGTKRKPARQLSDQGYVRVSGFSEHPNAYSNGTVLEHLLVMSEALNREIRTTQGENVHHKNGQRADNRLSNLELWFTSQPCGQRVSDKLDWAIELLETYADEYPDMIEEFLRRLKAHGM